MVSDGVFIVSDFDRFFPPGFTLETGKVTLRLMQKGDKADFLSISQSDILWKYFAKELNDETQLLEWMNEAITDNTNRKRFPFTILEKNTGFICGSTSFGNISFYDKRIEIGWSWLGESFLGSGVNRHSKFALLRYAFEVMNFERVEIKTDNLNERAKNALRKIGATEEGVLRSHMLMTHGRRRDSIYFSIIKNEWERVRDEFFNGY